MVTYKQAGVDIDKGNLLVKKLRRYAHSTFSKEVLSGLGGFSGLFELKIKKYKHPLLVSGTDGVGTKLKIAFMMNKHNTVGIDLVAMCVNDLVTSGARPLFFLDYLATGKLQVDTAARVIQGITRGCREAGCALIGGETAELPGFYGPGEYDLAGFVVGIVEKENLIDGTKIKPGNLVIGLASNGLHSNGYSLVRKIFFQKCRYQIDSRLKGLKATLGQELLRPTKIYVKEILDLLSPTQRLKKSVYGIAHITGGGFIDNLPRILPSNCAVVIEKKTWKVPSMFNLVQEKGGLKDHQMFRVFNMGIGMVLVVERKQAPRILKTIPSAKIIGEVIQGRKGVRIV